MSLSKVLAAKSLVLFSAFSLLLASVATTPRAHAGEGVMDVARNQQQKQAIIQFLKARLEMHRHMTRDQILADLNQSVARNSGLLAQRSDADAQSFEKLVTQENDELRADFRFQTRAGLLIAEEQNLQMVQSSDNYMLFMMNHVSMQLSYLACHCYDTTLGIVFAIFLVPFDIVFLPIEFIASAVTGF